MLLVRVLVRVPRLGWPACIHSCITKQISVGEQPGDLVPRQETLQGEMGQAGDVGVTLVGLVFRDQQDLVAVAAARHDVGL